MAINNIFIDFLEKKFIPSPLFRFAHLLLLVEFWILQRPSFRLTKLCSELDKSMA